MTNPAGTITCPDPTVHEPDCNDTRYDDRGDCNGNVRQYEVTAYILGARPEERVQMCGSHGRQAVRKGEAKRV